MLLLRPLVINNDPLNGLTERKSIFLAFGGTVPIEAEGER